MDLSKVDFEDLIEEMLRRLNEDPQRPGLTFRDDARTRDEFLRLVQGGFSIP